MYGVAKTQKSRRGNTEKEQRQRTGSAHRKAHCKTAVMETVGCRNPLSAHTRMQAAPQWNVRLKYGNMVTINIYQQAKNQSDKTDAGPEVRVCPPGP